MRVHVHKTLLEWGAYKEAVDQINGDLSKELDRAGFFVSATLRRRSALPVLWSRNLCFGT